MSGFRPKKESTPQPAAAPAAPQASAVKEAPAGAVRVLAAIRTVLLLLVAAAIAAWALGVRVHPEALRHVRRAAAADTVLELRNGQTVMGQILSERGDRVVLLTEGSEVPFTRNEIENIRPAAVGEGASGASGGVKRPLFTIRAEHGLQYKLKNKKNLWP